MHRAAAVALLAHEVELRPGLHVAREAVTAETVVHLREAALVDLRAVA
jgi:hypothetical protein